MSLELRAALLLREYASEDELNAVEYFEPEEREGFAKRAKEALEVADKLDPEGANA